MNIPCKNAVTCPQDGNPLLGFSSEAPDIPQFIAVSFSPSVPVPLNFKFKDTGYVVFAQSPLDQETANLAAQVQGVEAFADNLTAPSGGPVATFYSAEIDMQGTCPDGSLFTYGIAASAFAALSQAEADYQAGTYAAQQMALTMLCLSSLEQTVLCLDAGYDATITAMGSSLAQPPDMNNWEVTAGSLPPGLTFNGGVTSNNYAAITGFSTEVGVYGFTVRVTTPKGDFMEKDYSITVGTYAANPAQANQFAPYSFQLPADGYSGAIFALGLGSVLPPGLAMTGGGLIWGTPTSYGVFEFEVVVTSPVADCSGLVSLTVEQFPVYTVSPDVTSAFLVELFFNPPGYVLPAGTYEIAYTGGALRYAGDSRWAVNLVNNTRGYSYQTQYPGVYQQFGNIFADYATAAAAETANAGQSVTVTTTAPGAIGIAWYDANAIPGIPAPPAPTFSLTRLS
jgi:hypothetical protein